MVNGGFLIFEMLFKHPRPDVFKCMLLFLSRWKRKFRFSLRVIGIWRMAELNASSYREKVKSPWKGMADCLFFSLAERETVRSSYRKTNLFRGQFFYCETLMILCKRSNIALEKILDLLSDHSTDVFSFVVRRDMLLAINISRIVAYCSKWFATAKRSYLAFKKVLAGWVLCWSIRFGPEKSIQVGPDCEFKNLRPAHSYNATRYHVYTQNVIERLFHNSMTTLGNNSKLFFCSHVC